jgi:hypothetical protein
MNSHINTASNIYLGSMRASFYLIVHPNKPAYVDLMMVIVRPKHVVY